MKKKLLAVYKYCVNKYDIAILIKYFFNIEFFLESLFKIHAFCCNLLLDRFQWQWISSGIKANVILMFFFLKNMKTDEIMLKFKVCVGVNKYNRYYSWNC